MRKQFFTLQLNIRRYLVQSNVINISSEYQTKDWRKSQIWYFNGKKNECEKYQKKQIETIINNPLKLSNERINKEKNNIETILNNKLSKLYNRFEYTENFDAKTFINNKSFYFNLKFICDSGGSQNRTLELVYHFIKYQNNVITINNIKNIYFINILDGDESYNNMNYYKYLLNKCSNNIYCGDMYNFKKWWVINNK
jgi:hypothetical protein